MPCWPSYPRAICKYTRFPKSVKPLPKIILRLCGFLCKTRRTAADDGDCSKHHHAALPILHTGDPLTLSAILDLLLLLRPPVQKRSFLNTANGPLANRSGHSRGVADLLAPAERLAFVLHDIFAVPLEGNRNYRWALARRGAAVREPRTAAGAGRRGVLKQSARGPKDFSRAARTVRPDLHSGSAGGGCASLCRRRWRCRPQARSLASRARQCRWALRCC
jgi:hypothetical protein